MRHQRKPMRPEGLKRTTKEEYAVYKKYHDKYSAVQTLFGRPRKQRYSENTSEG